MKKILLLWYMEEDNFGDSLLSETTQRYLEKKGYCVENHEVGDDTSIIVNHANLCDFVLFAGGGIIERYIPQVIYEIESFVNLLNVPYGIIGLSIGEFDYTKYKSMLKMWVDNALFVYTRDEYSKIRLNEYSSSDSVKCSTDCAFYSDRIVSVGIKKIGMDSIKVGINIRELPYSDITGKLDVETIKKVIANYDYSVIMDSSSLLNECNLLENRCEYEKYLKLNKYEKITYIINQIKNCSLIVSMRFHVVLVAAMLGIPVVAIRYCPKVTRLCEQLGILDVSVEVNNLEEIPKKIDTVMSSYELYCIRIDDCVRQQKLLAVNMYEDIITQL